MELCRHGDYRGQCLLCMGLSRPLPPHYPVDGLGAAVPETGRRPTHADTHRARTPDQKRRVMARILTTWLEHPDLRLGQLLAGCVGERALYNIEDFDLVDAVERPYYRDTRRK